MSIKFFIDFCAYVQLWKLSVNAKIQCFLFYRKDVLKHNLAYIGSLLQLVLCIVKFLAGLNLLLVD